MIYDEKQDFALYDEELALIVEALTSLALDFPESEDISLLLGKLIDSELYEG